MPPYARKTAYARCINGTSRRRGFATATTQRTLLADSFRACFFNDSAAGAAAASYAVAYPVSRIRFMKASHRASWSSVTNSLGRCASAMSPGPQITVGTPSC